MLENDHNWFVFSGDNVEVIEIHFDPTKITYSQLLEMFWENHEYRASARLKREYMTMIQYHSEDQRKLAEASKAAQQATEHEEVVATEIVPASPLYPAAEYVTGLIQIRAWLTYLGTLFQPQPKVSLAGSRRSGQGSRADLGAVAKLARSGPFERLSGGGRRAGAV